MKMQIEYITPDRAAALLADQIANRPVKVGHVERLVRAVNTGNFKLSPFPIVLDKAGHLVDGQHRLTACVQSGSVLPFWVARLDEGESALDIRMQGGATVAPTNADLLTFERPDEKYQTLRVAIAKYAFHLDSGLKLNLSVGYHEIRDVLDRNKEQIDYVVNLMTKATLHRLTPACFGGTVVWALTPKHTAAKIEAEVKSFAERYVVGEGLRVGDPEYTLRNAMLATQDVRIDRYSFVSKFCSLFVAARNGEKRSRAQGSLQAVEEIAKILGKTPPGWLRT